MRGMGKDMSIVKIRPEVVNNLGVRSAKVERGPYGKGLVLLVISIMTKLELIIFIPGQKVG